MQDLALEQISHGRETDVRVRAHVHPLTGRKRDRPEVIEEDERPDALARERGQHAPHLEPAEVARAPVNLLLDGAGARAWRARVAHPTDAVRVISPMRPLW
jgi:hypothetical protein